jgi:CubicO group peptidase (beta-lactamase class C family)
MRVDAGAVLERLEPLFRANFERLGELGAAVSVWHQGKPIANLTGGFRDAHREQPWRPDTLVLIWSATKGIGSACLLHLLQQYDIDLERRVAEFWPEFAQSGKEKITLGQLLSHQAGLSALDRRVDILDYPAVAVALAEQAPLWPPGTGHGYHARTFGFLLDELVRRIAGVPLSDYWRRVVADPVGLDIWIGLPQAETDRVATIYAAKAGKSPEPMEFYRDLARQGSFVRKVFTSPVGLHAVSAMNRPDARERSIVSFGGIATADALAKFYSLLANGGVWQGQTLFTPATIDRMKKTLSDGMDKVFGVPTAFSAGFMKDSTLAQKRIFGAADSAFGHPGAGGSHAFADPENGIAFAYVMNQMEQSVLPTEKSLRLVKAIYD